MIKGIIRRQIIAQILSGLLPLLLCDGLKPPGNRLIIVGSRISHAVFYVVMGQIIVGCTGIS